MNKEIVANNLRPSRAGRWVHCPGGLKYIDSPAGQPAKDGIHMHALAATWLNAGVRGLFPSKPEGSAPADFLEAAHAYAKNCLSVARTYRVFGGPYFGIEKKILMPSIHPLLSGTPDFFVFSREQNEIFISDLKTGFGPVGAYENWQLICYAQGVIDSVLGDLARPDTKVFLRIVQPRLYSRHSQWNTTVEGLKPYVATLRAAAENALSDKPSFKAGSHCQYCTGKANCPWLYGGAYLGVEYITGAPAIELTPLSIAKELDILTEAFDLLKHRIAGIEAAGMALIDGGAPIPGYTVDFRPGTLEWSVPEKDALGMATAVGVDITRPGLITPTQAKKAGLPEAILKLISKRKTGKKGLKKVKE